MLTHPSLCRPQVAEKEEEVWLATVQLHRRVGGVSRQTRGQESGGVASQYTDGHQETPAVLLRPLVHQGTFCLVTADVTVIKKETDLAVLLGGALLAATRTPIKFLHPHVNRLDKGSAFDLGKDGRLRLSVCVVPAQVPVDSPV